MKNILGIEYGRGACAAIAGTKTPASGPMAVKKLFPDLNWNIVSADNCSVADCMADRFGDTFKILQNVYANTPTMRHILIGGDHSVNFGHFAAIADKMQDQELCLIYIDAHLDIHTPESSVEQASGAPHGTNVRALTGNGDSRWLSLQKKIPALHTENLFYLGTRSYEPAEIEFVRANNIYMKTAQNLQTESDYMAATKEILEKIGNRPYVVSFDLDAIDPTLFTDVLVPEPNGISFAAAKYFTETFAPKCQSFEFVEFAPTGDIKSQEIIKTLMQITIES